MRTTDLPDGQPVPVLGLGTWRMGEDPRRRAAELRALRTAFEIGYRLIDSAEMYGEGGAESMVGQAIAAAILAGEVRREDLTIVSKVYPHNASERGVQAACRRSLDRLGLDYLDLYLLHWPGNHPLSATVAGFEALRGLGLIRHWGVSNFDVTEMELLWSLPTPRHRAVGCSVNQVYYSPSQRGIEFALMPLLATRRMPVMAYSPTDQGKLATDPVLKEIGARHDATAVQVALAWLLARPQVIVIPKAVSAAHLRENYDALGLQLDSADFEAIDRRFPPPSTPQPLAML
jgi:diketogulonate reductase-like aldo/keto reductase